MASTNVVKPAVGEKVYRMSNTPLIDKETNKPLPNCSGNVVNFLVKYSKEFTGAVKYLKEESVHVLHVIHAEALEKLGIGKIQKV